MKKNNILLLSVICISFFSCRNENTQNTYAIPYFSGVGNNGKHTDNPYLTAGDKAFIIGAQDGNFPDIGHHLRGEMGGIWTLPVKLADGFWLKLSDAATREERWLMEADTFINYPEYNRFIYNSVLDGIKVNRTQFAPEGKTGVVIEYTFENLSKTAQTINLDFVVKTEVSPVWFSKQNGIIDGVDTVFRNTADQLFIAKDKLHEWYAVWGTDASVSNYTENSHCPVETAGNGTAATLNSILELKPGRKKIITYYICGSMKSQADAKAVFADLSANKKAMLAHKTALYQSVLERAKIEIPDKKLEETYNWVKINTQWLVSDLTDIGRFLGAGAVEYPWLFGCDNSYALQGVLATSDFELAKSTLLLLKQVSEKVNGNGRIIHEMSSNGFVYNKGNTQETAHFILAAWKCFLWTGDMDFLKEVYPYIKLGIDWLTAEMDKNQNLFPEGYGIMEISGLSAELIDVAVYTEQALEVTAKMAAVMNEQLLSQDLQAKAETLKEKINTQFWDEENDMYYDFYGTREQAISVAQGAIKQINNRTDTVSRNEKIARYQSLIDKFEKFPAGTEKGWTTSKVWVINTPIETGIAPKEKAIRSLDKIRKENCGAYGPYLSAVDRNEAMTISTGVQAMSEACYGRTDEMLWYINAIANTLHTTLPGSINEMMPGTQPGAIPKYMFVYGCPVQAWTIYGVATPIITHIFGVSPDAYHKTVVFEPHLPANWNNMSLSDLRVGENAFSMKVVRDETKTIYDISSNEDDWNYTLRLPSATDKHYELNGQKAILQQADIPLTGKRNRVIIIN